MHRVLTLVLLWVFVSLPTNASSNVTEEYIPNAKLVGEGKLRFMFWDIYEAKLFAPNGEYESDSKFSLKLKYFRDFKSIDIAERSIKEIKTQGYDNPDKLKEWSDLMNNIFPDVVGGSVLEGIFLGDKTVFYHNDIKIADITDKEFGVRFFNIWLGPETTEPRLRKKLLGLI